MLYYDRINISERIDTNKTSKSKECDICHCWYVSNGYYGVLMMSMNISNIAILNIQGANYCCFSIGISKSEAVNLLHKADLNEKSGTL